MENYDFSGWATRNDIRCSDGRTIRKDAFKDCDGLTVPLVWNHQHNDPSNVLGHALLENRPEGVYAYGSFNSTEMGQNAREYVIHGDIDALSIYANKLQQSGSGDVLHGVIREVSLVLAGANPGAFIDTVIAHSDSSDEEAIIYTGEKLEMAHAEEAEEPQTKEEEKEMPEKEKTVKDVFDSMTEEQKNVVYFMIGQALEDAKGSSDEDEEEEEVKHNVFDEETQNTNDYLTHSDMQAILADGKRYGSLKESALQHGFEDIYGTSMAHAITDDPETFPTSATYLFPDARTMSAQPSFVKRQTEWVSKFMNGTHHTPFSRIKSVFADITADAARAKGYVKGNLKVNEVLTLLKRTTTPTTVYKKQKMDRDDMIDITDFDVVSWIKGEMRLMLDEEIARAALVGDGRNPASDDKINESNIRPIWKDEDFFTIKSVVPGASLSDIAANFVAAALRARKDYRGSGNPILFTTEEMLTEMLLLTALDGRPLYEDENKLKTALRVRDIVTVPVMENLKRTDSGYDYTLRGIIVNPVDYNFGADKGGAVNLFDDFDIDYNAQKYLIETRCSGALTQPFSAIALESKAEAAQEDPGE